MRASTILACLMMAFLSGTSFAQVKVEFSESFTGDKLAALQLNVTQQQQIEAALTARLAEYVKRGKLLNPKTKMIDRESASSFKELFSLDAKVFNDIREIPEAYLRSLDEYIDLARSYFSAYGLSFGINNAKIIDGEYDDITGRYTFTVTVSKTVEQYFKENGIVENGTRTYTLDFIYSLKLNDLENARLNLIRQSIDDDAKPADLYVRLYNLSLGAGYVMPVYAETPFFKMDDKQGELNLRADLDLSIGLSYYSNFFSPKESPNKRLFFVGGVTGFYQKITGELRDYSTEGRLSIRGNTDTQNDVAGDVSRIARNVNVDEEQTLLGLRVPVGFGFRLFNNNTSFGMLNIQYTPSVVLSSLGKLKNGTGDYGMSILNKDGTEFYNSLELNAHSGDNGSLAQAYQIAVGKPIEAEPKISTSITHGITLSGLYFKDLVDDERTFGIALGVHYYMPFTGLWTFESGTDKPFLYPDRAEYVDSGLLAPFAEGVKLSHFGISLNIYNKKTRQP